MSRHYRLRGLAKLTKHKRGLKERIRRSKDIYLSENMKIDSIRKEFEEYGVLDPTFKWHRNSGMQFVTWETDDEMKAFRVDNLVYVKTHK